MTMDIAVLEKEALQLSEGDRALLADKLIESISEPPQQLRESWVSEAESRLEAYEKGKICSEDGESAMAQLRKRFQK